MIVHTGADQLLSQLLMDSLNTLLSHYRHIGNLHEEVWCWKNIFLQNGSFVNLDIFPTYIKWADSWENLLFAYFYGLCVLISFSLLTFTVRGVSNKHCLLPFFHFTSPLTPTENSKPSAIPLTCPPRSAAVYYVICISERNGNQFLPVYPPRLPRICLPWSLSRRVLIFNPFHCIPLSVGFSGLVKKKPRLYCSMNDVKPRR